MMVHTHTSKPAAESTRAVHCHPAAFRQRSTPFHDTYFPKTQLTLDNGAKLWAYLDDWYIWINPQHIPAAIELVANATLTINLVLQPTKILIWTASCTSPIPLDYLDKSKPTLKCLGAHLRIAGDSEGSSMELGGRPSMNTATTRFRNISTIMRDHNRAGLKMQTVNDLLTMYVGAASQHALRTTFVPFEEAASFDNEIVAYWSQLAGRDVTSPLFHLPLRMGGLRVGSAVQRHAAAPWTAWQTVIPTLMAATDSTDTDSLLAATSILRGLLLHLQSTLAHQTDNPALLLKPKVRPYAHMESKEHSSVPFSSPNTNKLWERMLITPSKERSSSHNRQKNTGVHLQQPSSEAAKPTKQTRDASKSQWLDGLC